MDKIKFSCLYKLSLEHKLCLYNKFLDKKNIVAKCILPYNEVISLWRQGVDNYELKVIHVFVLLTRSRIVMISIHHQLDRI